MKPITACSLLLALSLPAHAVDLGDVEMIDLTHAYNEETIYWPTAPTGFVLEELAHGRTDGGYFYSAYSLTTPEHGGTHLDAPMHFSADGRANHEMPLTQLIAPALVIDVSEQAAADRDYRLAVSDVEAFERLHGTIPAGSMVLLRTGWDRYWDDVAAYLGDDTPGDASHLSFPSYGVAAAKLLIEERGVTMLGVDTASIDYGRSTDFRVHRLAAANNVGGLENLMDLTRLPATGATVIALPMKIEGGSGGPVRAVALVAR